MREKQQVYRLPRHYVEVGTYLKSQRENAGLTQREVSEALGYSSAQFISNLECGVSLLPLKRIQVLLKMYGADATTFIELVLESERKILRATLGNSRRKRWS